MRKKHGLLWLVAAAVLLTGCGSDDGDYSKYVKLGDYKGLNADLVVEKITDEELEEYEKEQLADYVSYEEASGPVKEGQLVETSLLAKDGDEIVYDFSDDGYELMIGQEDFGEEVDAALVGGQVGDVLDFSVTYDEEFEDASLSGKEISYHIEIQKISDVIYPELTNEFVKESFGEQSVEEWKHTLTEELESAHQADATEEMRNDLEQQAVDNAQITGYPKELYRQKREAVQSNYQGYADMLGCSLDDVYAMFELDEEAREQEYRDETYRTMVLAVIRQQENITLSDAQYQEKLEEYAAENEYDSVEELLTDYDENSMREYFLNELTLDFLEEHANITVSES